MGTDNLKKNYDLIFNQKKKYYPHYFLIEANVEIPSPLYIANFINVYSLNQIDYNINLDHKFIQDFINKLKIYRDLNIEGKYYWLIIIKIVSLSQKPKPSPATKLSDVVDPDVGMSIHPSAILTDVLNIFSLYFKGWFKQIASLNYFEESDISIIREEKIESIDSRESKDLTQNIRTICDLRLNQFYLLEKCISRFHEAMMVSSFNLALSLTLLISAFDPAVLKYSKNGLIKYNLSNLRKEFLKKYYPPEELNEKTENLLDNLNYFYERYLNYGINFVIPNLRVIIKFNRFDQKNRLVIIPSLQNNEILFEKIFVNFIKTLFKLKDDEEDKSLYDRNDLIQRGAILVRITKPKKPGEVLFDTDISREIDYNDLQWFRNKSKFIEDLIRNEKYEESLLHINKAINFRLFNLNYYDCRKIIYLKIQVLSSLKKYEEIIDFSKEIKLLISPEENLDVFNLIAYSYAFLEKFEKAHRLINKIIELSKNEYQKANFLDSKGEFYQIQKKYNDAIKLYKRSLEYFSDPPYEFHKETLQKLQYCYSQVGRASEMEELEGKIRKFDKIKIEEFRIDVGKDDKFLLCHDSLDKEFANNIENYFSNEGIQLKTIEFLNFSKQFLDKFLSKLVNKNLIMIILISPNSSKNLWDQELNKHLTSELKFSNINLIPIAISNEKILSDLKYFEFININIELEKQLIKLSKKIKNLSKISLLDLSQERLIELIKSLLERENFEIIEENIMKDEYEIDFIAKEYFEDTSDYITVKNWIIETKLLPTSIRVENIHKLVNLIKNYFQNHNLLFITNSLLTTPLIEFISDIKTKYDFEIKVLDLIELRKLLYNYDDLIEKVSSF